MIVYLVACSTLSSESEPVAPEPAESWTAVVTATAEFDDPRLVELDASGELLLELHLSDILGAEWASLEPKPALSDVQPISGGTFLLPVFGVGLIEVDRSGKIVWRHNDPEASHDADRLSNGNTLYVRPWAAQGEAAVVEVDRSGREVWSWSGAKAYGADARFNGYQDEGGAWLHANAVQRLDDGRTSVCMRNLNIVALVSPEGEVTREVTFAQPEGRSGPDTLGNLQGTRPHAAEWTAAGLAVALRVPDRALTVLDGSKTFEYRSEGVQGITDIDRLAGGDWLIAAHDRVMRINGDGAVQWEWVEAQAALPEEDHDGGRERAGHAFFSISPIDTTGAPLDHD